MKAAFIIWPMFAHVVLVIGVYLELGRRRFKAAKAGEIKVDNFAIVRAESDTPWTGQAARNVVNQFELPVLFHVGCLVLLAWNGLTMFSLILAWVFVATRYMHSFEHLTKNRVMVRGTWFLSGVAIISVFWGLIAYQATIA